MTSILAWMPEEAYPVILVFIGIALIIGLINRQKAFALVGLIILFALLGPFISRLFDSLPLWITLLLIVVLFLILARAVLNLLFGRRATDHFVGELMFAVFLMPFRFLAYMFRPRRRRIW